MKDTLGYFRGWVMRQLSGQSLFLGAVIAASVLVVGYFAFFDHGVGVAPSYESALALKDIPFNGTETYEYLKKICDIGPRPSGSAGMAAQQKLLTDHFTKLGGHVRLQEFRIHHPEDGSPVSMANLIVEWHPERTERILLCTHYDTRPFPDRDKRNPKGRFIGANDGGSGVAVLMELARSMPKFNSRYGVDFLLVDGEEFVFREGDPYFLGAEWFARDYAGSQAQLPYHYRWGVLLDMVGGNNLRIPEDFNSILWDDTRPLVEQIWGVAHSLHVTEFVARRGPEVLDDHLRLHDIAKIPTCDIIDFENYRPYWHTEGDTPEHCSALSLAKVGWVLDEWLKRAK